MEKVMTENTFLHDELARRRVADELDRAARGGNKRTRYPEGFIFNQEWIEAHPEEIAKKRAAEQRRADQRRVAGQKHKGKGRALDTEGTGGPSGTVEDGNAPAVMHED
jgi:hypothetical protein